MLNILKNSADSIFSIVSISCIYWSSVTLHQISLAFGLLIGHCDIFAVFLLTK